MSSSSTASVSPFISDGEFDLDRFALLNKATQALFLHLINATLELTQLPPPPPAGDVVRPIALPWSIDSVRNFRVTLMEALERDLQAIEQKAGLEKMLQRIDQVLVWCAHRESGLKETDEEREKRQKRELNLLYSSPLACTKAARMQALRAQQERLNVVEQQIDEEVKEADRVLSRLRDELQEEQRTIEEAVGWIKRNHDQLQSLYSNSSSSSA